MVLTSRRVSGAVVSSTAGLNAIHLPDTVSHSGGHMDEHGVTVPCLSNRRVDVCKNISSPSERDKRVLQEITKTC